MWKLSWSMLAFGLIQLACTDVSNESFGKVTSGKDELGFPYVVRFSIDGQGVCTGSFVSDSLMLTAAHCVDTAKTISWNNIKVSRANFLIHPEWPINGEEFGKARNPKYDSALIKFPVNSYQGTEYAVLLKESPEVGEEITIVGFGNNLVTPYDTYCKLSNMTNEKGLCTVTKSVRQTGAQYSSEIAFSFDGAAGEGQGAYCTQEALTDALLEQNTSFAVFVDAECDGNFRDRSYKETGVGKKRSGTNIISDVSGGLIFFSGTTGGANDGINSASGAGDSGGPLFVKRGDVYRLAGTTHGGSLGDRDDQFIKNSTYVDVSAPYIVDWFTDTMAKKDLDFPDYANN